MEQQTNQAELVDDVESEGEEPHIHLPSPSWAPIILALGLTGVAFGVVLGGGILLVAGAVVMLVGLGMWIYDEIKHAADADADAEAPHSSHPA
jgi:hypothetical protein